jgi:hypothetical protein
LRWLDRRERRKFHFARGFGRGPILDALILIRAPLEGSGVVVTQETQSEDDHHTDGQGIRHARVDGSFAVDRGNATLTSYDLRSSVRLWVST